MKRFSISLIALICCALQLQSAQAAESVTASDKAHELAQKYLIVDGHIDVPYRILEHWEDVSEATEKGDFDYPRAKSGGLNAPFMSIYIPAKYDGTDQAIQHAHTSIDSIEALVGRAPDKFAIATSPADVRSQAEQGLISLPLGMENGSPIKSDLNNLELFYDRGIRYITLTHSKSNHISDSSYDDNKRWGGLSPFGEKLIPAMNRLGIMVDISHVSDEAFYDALKITKAPMIASHSSLRTFTPGFERNMDDDMVKALAKNGGVIMINFGSTFLTKQAREWSDTRADAIDELKAKHGEDSQEVKDFEASYRDNHPLPFANLSDVIEQIDYAVKLVGIDYVGLGSDYDGVGDSLPNDLKHAGQYPNLVQGLLDLDYSEADIEKILGGNALRVWSEVEEFAAMQ